MTDFENTLAQYTEARKPEVERILKEAAAERKRFMAKRNPTVRDLLEMSEYGDGFGYLGHQIRRAEGWKDSANPYEAAQVLDAALVAEANRLKLTTGQLFEYVNSRTARHDSDYAQSLSVEKAAAYLADTLAHFQKD